MQYHTAHNITRHAISHGTQYHTAHNITQHTIAYSAPQYRTANSITQHIMSHNFSTSYISAVKLLLDKLRVTNLFSIQSLDGWLSMDR